MTVYHAYRDGGFDGRVLQFWYTWEPSPDAQEFDARRLGGAAFPGGDADPLEAIRRHIDRADPVPVPSPR